MTDLVPGSPRFVERLLADRIGLDVASVGAGLIVRGVQNRMTQLGVRREEDYQRILLGPSDEIQALIEEVVIPESWFFRDEHPFATFREFVQTGWVDQPHRTPVSVLCLPCASGEEPYSVIIALLELGLPRNRFDVVAVDISQRSIRRAAAGLYSINAFRGMDLALQERYFDPAQGRFLLSPAVRTAVRLEQGNILDPNLLAGHSGFDVVFCRNLLIYFDDPARGRAFANLDRLTAPNGILFLGHADRPDPNVASQFVPLAAKGSFAYRKRGAGGVVLGPAATRPRVGATSRPGPVPRQSQSPLPTPAAPADRTAAAPPLPVVNPRGPASPGVDRDEVLMRASSLADRGQYIAAARVIHDELGSGGGLDARAHFLLGIIHQAAGERLQAEAELNKAIYLDPEHDEALLALAMLARRRGDVAAEALYRRRADRVMSRKGRT